nr:TPA_inf: conotoxin precursor P [Conus judaeus]
MHLSLAGSAVLMLLLLFALGVQSGQITRDADNGQLTDNRRNLQSMRKPKTLFKSLYKRSGCGEPCSEDADCPPGPSCPYCTHNLSRCM